jgi:hypothetical protein
MRLLVQADETEGAFVRCRKDRVTAGQDDVGWRRSDCQRAWSGPLAALVAVSVDEGRTDETGNLLDGRGEGQWVDGRSDIFSLGVVFYELLTGRRPFRGETRDELLEQITGVEARPPRQIDDQISMELERICLKALAKRASERYTTAKDLADDLRHFLGEAPGQGMNVVPAKSISAANNLPTRPPPRERLTRLVLAKRWRTAFLAAGLIAALVMAGTFPAYFAYRLKNSEITSKDLEIVSVDGKYKHGELDVRLRNTGDQPVVIHHITVTIIKDPGLVRRSGGIPTSGQYDVPIDGLRKGESRSISVSHYVDPHGVDRIAIHLQTHRTLRVLLTLHCNKNERAEVEVDL